MSAGDVRRQLPVIIMTNHNSKRPDPADRDKPKRPDPAGREKPSRFPEMFPHVEAEEKAAAYLHHHVEDDVLLKVDPEVPAFLEALGDGVRSCGVRYLILLNKERDNTSYDEWLLESLDEPYWRIVFRTNIENVWPPTRIMSVIGPKHAKKLLP